MIKEVRNCIQCSKWYLKTTMKEVVTDSKDKLTKKAFMCDECYKWL